MGQETHFIISKSNEQYSITEVGTSSVSHAFMTEERVSGDRGVLLRLFRVVPADQSLRKFIENNAGRLICVDEKSTDSAPRARA